MEVKRLGQVLSHQTLKARRALGELFCERPKYELSPMKFSGYTLSNWWVSDR